MFRFLKITSFYPQFLSEWYEKHPEAKALNYQEQYRALMASGWAWADHYQKELTLLSVEAHEVVLNAEPLQHAWAREHGVQGGALQIVFEQIKALKPEVLFFQDSFSFSPDYLREVRKVVPSVKLMLGWCAAPYSTAELSRFREMDLMLSCSAKFAQEFRDLGMKSEVLLHSFKVLKEFKSVEKTIDVLFAGSLIQGKGYHQARTELISSLIDSGIDLKLLTEMAPISKDLAKKGIGLSVEMLNRLGLGRFFTDTRLYGRAMRWKDIPIDVQLTRKLQKHSSPPQYGMELFKTMAKAKINLNSHIDVAGEYAANMRLFEATGVGSCLLTDWKVNLGELFEIDREVVAFRNSAECIEKARWLLNHPKEREEIAQAGQRRCEKDHSFSVRARQLLALIQKNL